MPDKIELSKVALREKAIEAHSGKLYRIELIRTLAGEREIILLGAKR